MITPSQFREVFDRYAHSVFRLEVLQEYAEPDEAPMLEAFSSGQRQPPDPGKQEWLAVLRSALATGRTVQRVHVVQEPLTDYLVYELAWSYNANVQAGENIRILPVAAGDAWPDDIWPQDFWLFDSSRLYIQHYSETGSWLGVELDPDPEHVVEACRTRDAAWHAAVPWLHYVRQQPRLIDAVRRTAA